MLQMEGEAAFKEKKKTFVKKMSVHIPWKWRCYFSGQTNYLFWLNVAYLADCGFMQIYVNEPTKWTALHSPW